MAALSSFSTKGLVLSVHWPNTRETKFLRLGGHSRCDCELFEVDAVAVAISADVVLCACAVAATKVPIRLTCQLPVPFFFNSVLAFSDMSFDYLCCPRPVLEPTCRRARWSSRVMTLAKLGHYFSFSKSPLQNIQNMTVMISICLLMDCSSNRDQSL